MPIPYLRLKTLHSYLPDESSSMSYRLRLEPGGNQTLSNMTAITVCTVWSGLVWYVHCTVTRYWFGIVWYVQSYRSGPVCGLTPVRSGLVCTVWSGLFCTFVQVWSGLVWSGLVLSVQSQYSGLVCTFIQVWSGLYSHTDLVRSCLVSSQCCVSYVFHRNDKLTSSDLAVLAGAKCSHCPGASAE